MHGTHCKHWSLITPLVSNNSLDLLRCECMCAETLLHIPTPWVGRIIRINIKNGNKRFICVKSLSSVYAFVACVLCLYTRHNFWCLLSNLDLSIHMYLFLHATWHSPGHSLGSFWLIWTCMFRFWSLELSGALHQRSSLPLGTGWLVPTSSVPDSSY